MAFFNPGRLKYEMRPPEPVLPRAVRVHAEPGVVGKKLRIPLEDEAVVTSRGVEWLSPPLQRIGLIR
jgi:hypothetical protein